MRLEYYDINELKKQLVSIFSKYLDSRDYAVFFFGSRVENQGNDRSDIDIGILGPPIKPSTWEKITNEVDNLQILYKIDLVDFNHVSEDFKKISLKNIELIYGKINNTQT